MPRLGSPALARGAAEWRPTQAMNTDDIPGVHPAFPRRQGSPAIPRGAVEQWATTKICVHPPSVDSKPFEEDKRVTRPLVETGELIGILVLDHVIIDHETITVSPTRDCFEKSP